jgi:hypothetical protein
MPDPTDPDRAARRDAIQSAIRAIGAADANAQDWVITPAGHAARYAEAAPDLAAVLSSSAVVVVAQRFEGLDARALEDQTTFNRTSARARMAVFLAGLASALLLAGGSLSVLWPATMVWVVRGAGVAALGCGLAATMWLQQLRQGRFLERWMTARAEAETARLHYFEKVTAATEDANPSLLLEYFRRYQLDVQRMYYGGRSEQHRHAADRALRLSTQGVMGGSFASGVAGLLGSHPAWTSLAALGLAGQAWGARMANEEATAQYQRNAERYGRTRLALDGVYERLDEVRAAVAGGHPEVMAEFVQAVHEQLSLEHRQWLEEMHGAGTAIGRLEELLDQYRGDGDGSAPAGPDAPDAGA